jgi:hypothetical protein
LLLSVKMPRMGQLMHSGRITRVTVTEGSPLKPGSKLFDVEVDLSAVAPQDCPPIFSFRMVAGERGWLRKLCAGVNDVKAVGDLLALVTTEPDEPIDGQPVRALRGANAGIMRDPNWL